MQTNQMKTLNLKVRHFILSLAPCIRPFGLGVLAFGPSKGGEEEGSFYICARLAFNKRNETRRGEEGGKGLELRRRRGRLQTVTFRHGEKLHSTSSTGALLMHPADAYNQRQLLRG